MVSFTDYYNAISIDRLSSKTKIGKDSWKRFMKIIILCKPEFSSATKSSILLKTQKSHSSASDWWEYTKYCFKENAKILSENSTTQDLVLRRMLELFLTVPPLKKYNNFKKEFDFFLKNTKNNLFSKYLMGKQQIQF